MIFLTVNQFIVFRLLYWPLDFTKSFPQITLICYTEIIVHSCWSWVLLLKSERCIWFNHPMCIVTNSHWFHAHINPYSQLFYILKKKICWYSIKIDISVFFLYRKMWFGNNWKFLRRAIFQFITLTIIVLLNLSPFAHWTK